MRNEEKGEKENAGRKRKSADVKVEKKEQQECQRAETRPFDPIFEFSIARRRTKGGERAKSTD